MDGPDYLSRSVGARAWWRSSSGVFTADRTGERVALVLAGAILLTGCFADPPADPEVQPLEIIAGNPDPDYGPCLLNVDEIGAGTHDVTPMSMSGEAKVRILDPSGAVIFKRALESHAAEGGGHEVLPEEEGAVRLVAGDHTVQCILSDGTHTTTLLVVPARPGYEEGRTG